MEVKDPVSAARPEVRAASVDVVEFSCALIAGILRAIDALPQAGRDRLRPWVWAGWIIGPDGPFGPTGPFGPGGPGTPSGTGER